MLEAPRAFNRHIYHLRDSVFYGTDDGRQDGSFGEYQEFVDHYNHVDPERKENIHMISVVGGLYGLNLIPLWKPQRLTIFDINPMAITYFRVIHHVFTTSNDAAHFLQRLTDGDYDTQTEDELFVKENIMMKQQGNLPRSRGSSKRTYELSWKYALENFDLTKKILSEALIEIRTEPMESESFSQMIQTGKNFWIYASNITQFHFFDLEFKDPGNCVILQIIFPGDEVQLLDLATYNGSSVKVNFRIPLSVEKIQP